MIDFEKFTAFLRKTNKSGNTIASYLYALRQFAALHTKVDKRALGLYKTYLLEQFKPKTVNIRLLALNCYVGSIGKPELKMPLVRIQQKPFLENVISDADYAYFKKRLNNPSERYWYFVIRFLAATGARISELLQLKVEHVTVGHIDLYSKGGKMRRIYIPQKLKSEAKQWLQDRQQGSGFIFTNKSGERITARGIAMQLKKLAIKYKLNPAVVYPHSFRHRFAKNFLEKFNDISLLADLMGHESIETTRIYLRRTSTEQRTIVDRVVTW
ncbi:MAG: tyrosine-type recombinase/integrase [Kiritimatiellia bacterium]